MSAPTRRAGVIAAVLVALAAVGLAAAWYLLGHRSGDDCANFQAMNSYNKGFQADLNGDFQADADKNDPEQDYATVRTEKFKSWAATMRDYADRFNDPGLRVKAESLADVADRYAALEPEIAADAYARANRTVGAPAGPAPPWAGEMGSLGEQFNRTVADMATTCPAR